MVDRAKSIFKIKPSYVNSLSFRFSFSYDFLEDSIMVRAARDIG